MLRRRQFIHEAPCIDWGIQKCKGGNPIFKRSPVRSKIAGTDRIVGERELFIDVRPERTKADPTAWAKKYLMAASISHLDLFPKSTGMKDKRFSSMLIQIIISLLEDKIRATDRNKEPKNRTVEGFIWDIRGGA